MQDFKDEDLNGFAPPQDNRPSNGPRGPPGPYRGMGDRLSDPCIFLIWMFIYHGCYVIASASDWVSKIFMIENISIGSFTGRDSFDNNRGAPRGNQG